MLGRRHRAHEVQAQVLDQGQVVQRVHPGVKNHAQLVAFGLELASQGTQGGLELVTSGRLPT
jgi:hypothetical protein